MLIADWIVLVMELIGTVAFAVSGGLIAIQKQLDFLGISVLACTTAVGGGMLRDILLGNTPPLMFRNPIYVSVSFLTACILMLLVLKFGNFMRNEKLARMKNVMTLINLFDAVGLGIFTVVGMNTAINCGYAQNGFLTIFVGVITGVGGGMLRDILVRNTPMVLRKEVYATAATIGGIVYYFLRFNYNNSASMVIGLLTIIGIRVLAIKKDWNLPSATK